MHGFENTQVLVLLGKTESLQNGDFNLTGSNAKESIYPGWQLAL